MNVELLCSMESEEAKRLLAFTKNTRLMNSPTGVPLDVSIENMNYIANTIKSSWEFIDFTFLVTGVSRACTHQMVRTRHGTYAQQSMRVTDMGDYDYVMPEGLSDAANAIIGNVNSVIKGAYRELIEVGTSPEDARGILPTNIATSIICKYNLRTFSELVNSRSGGRTQSEYQSVVKKMASIVIVEYPWMTPFLYPQGINYFDEIEAFAKEHYAGDVLAKGQLLKIVDKMRGVK